MSNKNTNAEMSRCIEVEMTTADGALGRLVVYNGGQTDVLWSRYSDAPTQSVRFSLIDPKLPAISGKIVETLTIDGNAWRSLESDDLKADFYKRVLTGTTLERSLKQSCVVLGSGDLDVTSTAGALEMAKGAVQAGLYLSRPYLLEPATAQAANDRMSRNGGAGKYLQGVLASLDEAATAHAKQNTSVISLSSFLRGEGFEIGHHDSQMKDIETAVRYLAQRLDEAESREERSSAAPRA